MPKGVTDFLRTPDWKRQRGWRTAIWKGLSRVGLTGLHFLPVHSDWVEVTRLPMPIAGLDPAFVGVRLVLISDLHFSPFVSMPYLVQTLEMVNGLAPDLIIVSGDLITGGRAFSMGIASLLASLRASIGTIATLGNHDYTMFGRDRSMRGKTVADRLEHDIENAGVTVLRNEQLHLTHNNSVKPLVIVGLDDVWSGHLDAGRAFTGLSEKESIVCINHDPANAKELLGFPWQWMLSGHTHGRAIDENAAVKRLSLARVREFVRGHYALAPGKDLYVNRGLAYGKSRDRHCLPEITVFTLCGAV